jgi:prevent-host-death family protein
VRHCRLTVKSATVRDLRNRFPRVAAWIEQGEPVQITKAGKPFARLVPIVPAKPRRLKMPDITERLKRTWGQRKFSAGQVEAMRAAELEHEDG